MPATLQSSRPERTPAEMPTPPNDASEQRDAPMREDRAIHHANFDDTFVALFDTHYPRLFRYLDRLTGDPDLAADMSQDALIRLYRRGAVPDVPGAWLVSVAMNLLRNTLSTQHRRRRLLTVERGERAHSDAHPASDAGVLSRETRDRVRKALDALPERDKRMLLLRGEGYSYREIAIALDMHEASMGTLLARAQREFRQRYGDNT